MSTYAEIPASGPGSEAPFPPAVTQRPAVPWLADDDVVLMPPFSRAALRTATLTAFEIMPEQVAEPTPSAAGIDTFGGLTESAEPAPPALAEAAQPAAADPDRVLAAEVAGRLESMAEELRRQGFHALLETRTEREPIDVVLASIIAGFLARR